MSRLNEEGPSALVQLPRPANKFPEFVRYIVRRLKVLCPTMGKERIAKVLCRAGLHLGATTVRRMLREPRKPVPVSAQQATKRRVTAREPNHVWHVDLSTVPTSLGFWTAWSPFALPQCWPFCWWIAIVVDHYSRRAMGVVASARVPSSAKVQALLDRVIQRTGLTAKHLITDHGRQFAAETFGRWCRRHGIRLRFGAIGKYGTLAVIERFIRSLKNECTRRILVPCRLADFQREMTLFISWYNAERPHGFLEARTPDEVYFRRRPACRAPRFEPRARWPRRSPCAGPNTLIRGRPGVQLELDVRFQRGRKHLPVVEVRRAA
jgi:putative transposase